MPNPLNSKTGKLLLSLSGPLQVPTRFELVIRVLQPHALPLGYGTILTPTGIEPKFAASAAYFVTAVNQNRRLSRRFVLPL